MRAVLRSFLRSVPRVYPGCIMLAQAVAFNMFLAFFPMLLIVAGVLTSSAGVPAGGEGKGARGGPAPPPRRPPVVGGPPGRRGAPPRGRGVVGPGGAPAR